MMYCDSKIESYMILMCEVLEYSILDVQFGLIPM